MSRLFNAYVMVDWSAASKPATGKDSLWIGVYKRDVRFRLAFEAHNPATREEAAAVLAQVIQDRAKRSERVLLGVDFPLGFPAGTAAKLALKSPDWRGLWDFLAANMVDKPNNLNNRFAVAAKMNRLMTDQPWPFWGCPASDAQRTLTTTKPTGPQDGAPPQQRQVELSLGKAASKPIWQMTGPGAVGPLAMTGVPRLRALRDGVEGAKVWPFETGLKALKESDLDGVSLLIAEVGALAEPKPEPGEIADRTQVRALCEHFARLDDNGKLGAVFGGEAKDTAAVEGEEGWVLGV
ncbi:MAG: cobalamin biosynthesis protein CbiG [Caulobacteraceae bacterium]|nr:cobalamin biosynthesis protein CbiG [Caulobacteraceae bacterium]